MFTSANTDTLSEQGFRCALLIMLSAFAGCMDDKQTPPGRVEADRTEFQTTSGRVPTGVAVSVSNRRVTVAWSALPGATSYVVAIRPKPELVPTWREYTTPASPYTIQDTWAMSGMQYEVRVAAVYAHGQSEWSSVSTITAPELQAAPTKAIKSTFPPYFVGKHITVGLHSERPFTNRSPWYWSICNADSSGCELLPMRQNEPSYVYLATPEMQGRQVSVQVDYDKNGVSYSASAALGVVTLNPFIVELAPGCPQERPEVMEPDTLLMTHLYALKQASAKVRWDNATGGAIAPLCNDVLVVSPWGRLALVRPTGEVAELDGAVPMNVAQLQAHPDKIDYTLKRFRVADILLKQHSAGRYELFVTHHYFTGSCIRFRLSSTMLMQQGADVLVSSAWRTRFDAEPCLPLRHDAHQAGGKMLTDGPGHLLVVIGDHGRGRFSQAADSHLGKLVRIEIETGHAETLAFGLRNPQGLARDGHGNLWETEHGPRGGDELNLLKPGGNFGWPLVTYGVGYERQVINASVPAEVGRHNGFVKPAFAWVPSIAISSIIVNDVRLFPLWRDDLLIGSLAGTKKSGRSLFRVRRDGTEVKYFERIEVGYKIRDLAQMPDGRIALLAEGGQVYFWTYSQILFHLPAAPQVRELIDEQDAVTSAGARLYDAYCSRCHSLYVEEHGIGPHLVGVLGRRTGSVSGYPFSDGLASLHLAWTPTRLERYLANPRQFAPGTSKSPLNITQEEAGAIAAFIGGD